MGFTVLGMTNKISLAATLVFENILIHVCFKRFNVYLDIPGPMLRVKCLGTVDHLKTKLD